MLYLNPTSKAVFISPLRGLDVRIYFHCYNHFIPTGFIFRLSFYGFNFFKSLIMCCKSILYLYYATFGFNPEGGIYFTPSGFKCTHIFSLL